MAVFLGTSGNVRLRRGLDVSYGVLTDEIKKEDVNTTLNRLGFVSSLDNLLTGDRVEITTTDGSDLICFAPSAWSANEVQNSITAYVNVNAAGGLRFFETFDYAVNNIRAFEYELVAFDAPPIPISVKVRDNTFNILGNVTSYQVNTDRETIDVTALSDKFRRQYSAGLISGAGSIDCLFDFESTGIAETPLLMLQLIQRIDIGSEFDLLLYLTDKDLGASNNVFYQIDALVSRAGVTVDANNAVTCTIDFVSTGEIRLLVGTPPAFFLLTDDSDKIQLENGIDDLTEEVSD